MRNVESGMNERWHELIARLQIRQISAAEFAELEATLAKRGRCFGRRVASTRSCNDNRKGFS